MTLTLGQAAKAAGVTRTAIQHAIAGGRLSAAKDELGRWQIDPSELARVYKPVANNVTASVAPVAADSALGDSAEMRELRARLADAHETIADLRHRLDQEAEERRRLTLLLTDQRPRRRWWRLGRQSQP
jgi:hypothetical protein